MTLAPDIRALFRAFRHRDFRIFWTGQLVSLLGTWMQTTAQAWLVLELTGSSVRLGVVTAMQFLPILFLSLFTGPFIDRYPKRRIILLCQAALMLQAFALFALTALDAVRYWHIAVLAGVLGIVNTVDMPARQAYLIEIVGRDDLMNAVGLNSAIFNAARAMGPALAGLVIAALGTSACFLLNGVSYVAVLAGLFVMRSGDGAREKRTDTALGRDIAEAIDHIRRTPPVLVTICLVAVVSVFAANYNVLVPVFARLELDRGPAEFGFLLSSFGAGALAGALSLVFLSRSGPRPVMLFGSGLALAFFLVVLGFQRGYGATAFLLACCGWCIVAFFGTANTTVQLNSDDRVRGRIMSIYTLAFAGLSPLGSLFAGASANWLHASGAFALGGLITGAFFLAIYRRIRNAGAERSSMLS